MISVLILTKNEALDLPGALASVAWSNDIHVFDSHSTDETIQIAAAAGAHVHQRSFDNYAAQRNCALQLHFANPWLLILDADERPTAALSAEIQRVVRTVPSTTAAFRLRRRDFLFNTWLKHAQMTPFYIRLVRPQCVHYQRSVNEMLQVTGVIEDLLNPLDHFPFSKGMTQWLTRHNRYSSLEAQLVSQANLIHPSLRTALRDPDFHTRRLHQKAIFYKLPGRPLIKLIYLLVVRGAIFDGYPGITYALLTSIYEYFIVLKTHELRLNAERPHSPELQSRE